MTILRNIQKPDDLLLFAPKQNMHLFIGGDFFFFLDKSLLREEKEISNLFILNIEIKGIENEKSSINSYVII